MVTKRTWRARLWRAVKVMLWGVAALVVMGTVLYFFGLRIVLDGGGSLGLAFVESPEALAAEVERHRQAQRAAAPPTTQAVPQPAAPPVAPALAAAPIAAGAAAPGTPRDSTITTAYWTGFRGADRDGHYREMPVFTAWPSEGLRPMWKQPVGAGYASFVVAGGRAFTIEQRAAKEVVAAYDVATGREIWTDAWDANFREFMGGDGPRATPAWSDGHVYALGAEGELRSLDAATGRVVWRKNILEDNSATNLQWGMAASPLVVDDMVVVLPGGGSGRSVVAYNRKNGERLWFALDDRQAYVSPMVATLAGVRQLIIVSASRMMGLSLDRGEVLWSYPWVTQFDINAAQPLVVGHDRMFISSGYGVGAAVVEIVKGDAGFSVKEVWRNIHMKNQFGSSVLHDGFVYGLDEAILGCVDVATGERKWKGGRYGYGQVILASGHLIVVTEDGDLALVRATPAAHQEITRFSVLDGRTWNHPAIAGGILLVRNLKEMAAFDLRAKP